MTLTHTDQAGVLVLTAPERSVGVLRGTWLTWETFQGG